MTAYYKVELCTTANGYLREDREYYNNNGTGRSIYDYEKQVFQSIIVKKISPYFVKEIATGVIFPLVYGDSSSGLNKSLFQGIVSSFVMADSQAEGIPYLLERRRATKEEVKAYLSHCYAYNFAETLKMEKAKQEERAQERYKNFQRILGSCERKSVRR